MKKLVLAICMFSLFSTGCDIINPLSPIGIAVNFYIKWSEGEAKKHYRWDTATVYKSVKRALGNLEYTILEDTVTDEGYYLRAGANDKFKIKITKVESEITKLSIRINFMGDKEYAELIYNEVDQQLDIIEYKRKKRLQR